ncbi:hypothetical protein ABZ942_05945 [Nocardia sp. NPDC046473]|uniref:hypothetical protein n=1 Tax=Nocardia sp. NPDC046473 TaxID=3155733 RepID=UPI0033D1777E
MGKNVWVGLQIVGMVLLVASAQAVIRLVIDHRKSQVWGLLDWVPGGWGGQLVVLVVLATGGGILAERANNRVKLLEA